MGETIPDGTNLQPGHHFEKTWTIKNDGSSTWEKSFKLVRTASTPVNESLGSPEHIPLAQEVKPGETIEIKVDLVAPQQDGQYTVYYELRDGAGLSVLNSQIWVTITVGNIPVSTSGEYGVSAQLLSAYMDHSEFKVDFCMQLPDERQWYPENVLLLVNHQQYAPVASRIDPIGATTANKCFNFSFPVTISSKTAYQLSLKSGTTAVHQDENCARAQTLLRAAYPIRFQLRWTWFWYTHLVLPAGMTEEQADQLILMRCPARFTVHGY